jgi:hypothetical protein
MGIFLRRDFYQMKLSPSQDSDEENKKIQQPDSAPDDNS